MKLGIVYKGGKIINHRSFIKVVLNPILRYFGYQIYTVFNQNKLYNIGVGKCDRIEPIKWNFKFNTDYDKIVKKRLIF
jgi:hypothetical protein